MPRNRILIISEVCTPLKYASIEKQRIRNILPSQQYYFWRMALALSSDESTFVDCLTIRPVSFSSCKKRFWRTEIENYSEKLKIQYVAFINGRISKYITSSIALNRAFKRWIELNRNEKKVIIIDGLQAIYAHHIIDIAKDNGIQIAAVITDLPSFVTDTVHTDYLKVKKLIQKIIDKVAYILINRFDRYIVLTKYMNERINRKNKPYIVIEGIGPTFQFVSHEIRENSNAKIIMYAGGVYEKYGIRTLVEGFKGIKNENIELHIYGPGDAVQYVRNTSLVDRRVKYCGVVAADEMPQIEQSASLLVITRPTDEEYTKYSFPSKIIEYMASGTPILSTKLAGIPDEYKDHIFWFEEESVRGISSRLKEVIEKDDQELDAFGKAAQKFLLAEKSAQGIAARLIKFLYS